MKSATRDLLAGFAFLRNTYGTAKRRDLSRKLHAQELAKWRCKYKRSELALVVKALAIASNQVVLPPGRSMQLF